MTDWQLQTFRVSVKYKVMKKLFESLGSNIYIADDFSELSYQVGNYGNNVIWVCDSNTARMVRPMPEPNVILSPGETSKNWQSIERILGVASDAKITRDGYFIALGGGVICDVAGFAGSVYNRGCKVILIPTTLLSMVDASLGGKTGINFHNAKNQIGTFYPAKDVLICIDCLKYLSQKEFINGLAEVIKHAFLTENKALYELLRDSNADILSRNKEVLRKLVELSLDVKRSYIEQDPKETNGIRTALNLGHTFAHALESFTRMQWSHGEAVAWGVCRAAAISLEFGKCSLAFENQVYKLFQSFGYNIDYRIDRGEWLAFSSYINKDKKRFDGKVKFVLPLDFGKWETVSIEDEIVRKHVIRPTF